MYRCSREGTVFDSPNLATATVRYTTKSTDETSHSCVA
jgi:hypothetical protein